MNKYAILRRLVILIGLLAILGGCQSMAQPTDVTGELGNPVRPRSPADVYIELGTAYLGKGRLDEAFKNARKAILMDAKSSAAHNLLGVVYQRLGKHALAGQHYRRAVELDGQNPYALNALGQYICAQGQLAEADRLFVRALHNPLYPTPWIAAHNAGLCIAKTQQAQKAESYYRQALQTNPRFAPALLRMAELSYTQSHFLSARAYLQRYKQVEKHTAESLWLGIRTERQLDDKAQAANYILQLRAKFPDSEQARYLNRAE